MQLAECWQFVYPVCELEIIGFKASFERVCMSELKLLAYSYAKNIQV